MEQYFYYGYSALMGALISSIIVACNVIDTPNAYFVIAVILVIPFDILRDEFRIARNQRATNFTYIMFGSGLVATITTLHLFGGVS